MIITLACVVSCEQEPEHEVLRGTLPKVGSDAYYENLRAYKKGDHAIAFGWWGRSGSAPTADMSSRYIALPDSMDIVSLWGGMPSDPLSIEEMRFCQRVKGTRFVTCMFGSKVDKLMRKNFPELAEKNILAAIDAVAKSVADTVNKYELDGFDLDYEPSYGDGGIFGHGAGGINGGGDIYTQRLFKALSQYLGPMSGTGKLLIIDGEMERGIIPYIDYLIQQTYNSRTFDKLQERFKNYGFGILSSKKFVCSENMQANGAFGAEFMYNGENIGSLTGMALWNPHEGRKGGFGAYLMEGDYESNLAEPYYYMRRGIQIQNPALK